MENATAQEPYLRTSVLVVGGSIVGLATAMFLAARGVPTIVIERHPSSSPHPRATGFYPRTLETFRTVGLDVSFPGAKTGDSPRRRRVESLTGTWFEEQNWTPKSESDTPKQKASDFSMYKGIGIAQDRLEPLLRQRASELGADVRMATTMLSFTQDETGVTAELRSPDGDLYQVRAQYLVAADGGDSQIREKLGIARTGVGHIRTVRSVLFTADLDEYLSSGANQFSIDQPDFNAFLSTYNDGRWILMFSDDEERDETQLLEMIHRAIGPRKVDVELVTTGRWKLGGLVAERFSDGRIFLAGDCAHALPPNRGGFGANTGIEDAHNLAWKLAAVLAGESAPELLETYDAERRPIAVLRHDQIFARDDINVSLGVSLPKVELFDDAAMELGQLYRSSAVLGAGPDLPPARMPDQWNGQPGTRAPHLWVEADGERTSTIDLLTHEWTVVASSAPWAAAAAGMEAETGISVTALLLGTDIVSPDGDDVAAAFGLAPGGAALIRPDGYIAWRSGPADDPRAALAHALAHVASAARAAQALQEGTTR